jgi:hypothetical protein
MAWQRVLFDQLLALVGKIFLRSQSRRRRESKKQSHAECDKRDARVSAKSPSPTQHPYPHSASPEK